MAEIIKVSQESTQQLQKQLDEYKEKNQQQLVDSQQRLKDKTLELEKAYQTILKMQEQVLTSDLMFVNLSSFVLLFVRSILPACLPAIKHQLDHVTQSIN